MTVSSNCMRPAAMNGGIRLACISALGLVLMSGQLAAKERPSLRGRVLDAYGHQQEEVLLRITVAGCAPHCPKPLYARTDNDGWFFFYRVAPGSYELDVIRDSDNALFHREIVSLPRTEPLIVVVDTRHAPPRRYGNE